MILEKTSFLQSCIVQTFVHGSAPSQSGHTLISLDNRLIKYISDRLHRIPAFVFDFPTDSDSMYAEWYSGNSGLGFAFFVNDFLVSLRYLQFHDRFYLMLLTWASVAYKTIMFSIAGLHPFDEPNITQDTGQVLLVNQCILYQVPQLLSEVVEFTWEIHLTCLLRILHILCV